MVERIHKSEWVGTIPDLKKECPTVLWGPQSKGKEEKEKKEEKMNKMELKPTYVSSKKGWTEGRHVFKVRWIRMNLDKDKLREHR